MKSFRERTVDGVAWSVLSQFGRQVIVLLANVALARLLSPHDFGLVATALIFANFATIMVEQGLGPALIQRREITEAHRTSVYWVNLALGALMTGVFLAAAPAAARAYSQPELTAPMRIIALVFVINAASMMQYTLLTRDLDFRGIAKSEILAAWCASCLSVALAWAGWGARSIAAQEVAGAVVVGVMFWRMSAWRPRFEFQWAAIRELWGFSANILSWNVANYWVRNVDTLLIGYFLTPSDLGLYSRAYAVMLFPLTRVTQVLQRVMFPSFSRIQDDHERVRSLFLRANRVVSLATFPMMFGVAATADTFVAVLFGPKWGGMVPVLRILSLVGMVESVSALMSSLYFAQNHSGLKLRVDLPLQALRILAIIVGLRWGILGVAACYAAMTVASVPVDCFFGGRLIGMSLRDYFRNLAPTFLCAGAMALLVAGLSVALAAWPAPLSFAVEIAAGGAVYFALLHVFRVAAYRETLDMARERLAGRSFPWLGRDAAQ